MPVLPSSSLVVALSGGIGGAKLALGLDRILAPGQLTVIANTGDDFEHLGLSISPDVDTLLYTLGGRDDPQRGWGRRAETWTFMQALAELGGETWFQLGDGDLATHIERSRRLRQGESLSAITMDFARRFAIASRILPMSDASVRTKIKSGGGWIDFQDYFVRQRCEPKVESLVFEGAERAPPNPDFLALLADPALAAVVVCPSNPWISIEPILVLPGVRQALANCRAPVIAVSPIIAGKAVKGPTAKMMAELGDEVSAAAVARHYQAFLDGYVIDEADADEMPDLDVPVTIAPTLMVSLDDRLRLARIVLEKAAKLAPGKARRNARLQPGNGS
jgi:LPPG:FO 2-phospho-L-lactate transferase